VDLTREDILKLLDELIVELKAAGVRGKISIYGGSAVCFYHPERGVTRDIDSMFEPAKQIIDVARNLTSKHPGLQHGWLNRAIIPIMPPLPDNSPTTYYNDGELTIEFASEEYLLAMKAVVSRKAEQDLLDAAILYNSLGLKSWLDISSIVGKYHQGSSWGSQELFWEEIEELAETIKQPLQ
jgi:hypothetical protein